MSKFGKLVLQAAAGARSGADRTMLAAANLIKVEAQISITTGATNARGEHVRSRPGEAPNNEEGELADSIQSLKVAPLHSVVIADAGHAVPLEFGTSKMAERPFLRPALEAKRREASALIMRGAADGIRRAAASFKGD